MLNNVIYDALINLDPTTFEELPWLAESWETEPWTTPEGEEGLKLTFNLIDDVTWHDGEPLTAEDVVFTWNYALEQENPVYISYLSGLVDTETEGANTAIAYLNTSSFWALHWLGANIPIIPKHIWENVEDSVTYQPIADGNLIGSGPYKFKEYKPGEYVLVEANPKWFLKPADSTLGYTTYTLTQGDTQAFTKKVTLGTTAITNGTYTAVVQTASGAAVETFTGSASADGTYIVTVDTTDIEPGTYTITIEFTAPVTAVGIGSRDDYNLVIEELPPDNTMYYAGLVVVVVIVAGGYIIMRRRTS
jgi:ABC-type transport system substrate-binding protein